MRWVEWLPALSKKCDAYSPLAASYPMISHAAAIEVADAAYAV
jgi:hypothetical protein